MPTLIDFFGLNGLIPHGYCLSWSPILLWLHVISDILITFAYYSIPLTLIYFIRQRKDFPYPWLAVLFAGFIIACGTTHLLSAITVWIPLYWLDGLVKAVTAVLSVLTAVLMVWLTPRILSMPSIAQLQAEINHRKTAENAQLATLLKLEKIASRLPGFVYQYRLYPDGSSGLPYASAGIFDIYRLSPEDANTNISQLFLRTHPDDYDELFTSIEQSAQDLSAWSHEYRVKFDDGTIQWLFGNALPEWEADGSTLWHGFITDITERKQMEEQLRDNEVFNASILDSLTAKIAVLDEQGVIVAVNKAWRQFTQTESSQNTLDLLCFDISKDSNHEVADTALLGIIAVLSGEQNSFYMEYPCQQYWFEMTVSPLQGSRRLAVVKYVDITERKLAEQVLHQLKAMIDISLDGFWIVDLIGNLRQVNQAYATISGYSIAELEQMNIGQLEANENTEQITAHIKKVIAQGYDLFESRHRRKDGLIIDVEVSVAFLPDFQQFYVFCRDISARKKNENITLAAALYSRSLLETSLDPMITISIEGKITDVNIATEQVTGLDRDKLIGSDFVDYFTDAEQAYEGYRRAFMHDFVTDYPLAIRHVSGKITEVLYNASVYYNATGSVQGVFAAARDITERKLLEDELKISEEKFRAIIEASPVPMALHDKNMNITLLNQAFVHTFGYNLDDIPTMTDWSIEAYPDPDYRKSVQSAWKSAQEQSLEVAIRCKNNSIKTVLMSGATVQSNSFDIYLATLYDISPRKQIEAKLNAIFNASVEGIITADLSGLILSTNVAIETIFGYQPEQLPGCRLDKLIPLMTVPSAGKIKEVDGLHKNGKVVPLDLSVAAYTIDDTEYFTYIVRDVSLRKHREQLDKEHLNQLAHVTRLGLMGEMASGIAHEVNQPLAAISSYTQVSLNLIKAPHPDLPKITEIVIKTQQQALRAGQIIHRMREFVKSHTKQRSAMDINVLIHEAVSLCIAEVKEHNIKLTLELESNLPILYVDQIQIEQVIINLIRNSIDALHNKPLDQQRQLTLQSFTTLENTIQVSIKDNGVGLDDEQQQKIVMPFYTTKSDGMGMGLSISRSLIEAHQGRLLFNSKLGKGSTFYFTLPLLKTY
jgi:PAS domain S-box-containing protein